MTPPPRYFNLNLGTIEYAQKLNHQASNLFVSTLAYTDWSGNMHIKTQSILDRICNPLLTDREILLHEQAHSFEIRCKRDRPEEWQRFSKEFKPASWEDFAETFVKVRKHGAKTSRQKIAESFAMGNFKVHRPKQVSKAQQKSQRSDLNR